MVLSVIRQGGREKEMAIYALIVAGGKSRRMGEGINKLLLPLRGKTVIENNIDLFLEEKDLQGIVVVTSDPFIMELAKDRGCLVAPSGEERQDSVMSGLELLSDEDYVLVQDGARPFLTKEALKSCIAMAKKKKNFILGIPITDTLKLVRDGKVESTLSREDHILVQTPQGARVGSLKRAYEVVISEKLLVTDDSSALELIGEEVYVLPGSQDNRKITSPEDMRYLK